MLVHLCLSVLLSLTVTQIVCICTIVSELINDDADVNISLVVLQTAILLSRLLETDFFAVLVSVLVSALPVLVLASVSKCRYWTSFQDHSCICRTISFGCLFLPVTQVTKFLTSLSLDLLFFVIIITSLRYILKFSCVIFYRDCLLVVLVLVLKVLVLALALVLRDYSSWSWSWSWNSGLDYKTGNNDCRHWGT